MPSSLIFNKDNAVECLTDDRVDYEQTSGSQVPDDTSATWNTTGQMPPGCRHQCCHLGRYGPDRNS